MKLSQFIPRLDALATQSFMDRVKREVAYQGLRLIAQTFATETDPYGQLWSELKNPRSGHGIEWKSGNLRSRWQAYPTVTGVRFSNDAPYANRQNYGSKENNQPPRLMIPRASRGLPDSWKQAIQRAFFRQIHQAVRP